MTKRFISFEREITIYGLNVSKWRVMIDGSPLYAPDGERAVYKSQREAQTAGFAFVYALAEDEV